MKKDLRLARHRGSRTGDPSSNGHGGHRRAQRAIRSYGPLLAYPLAEPDRRFVIVTTGRAGSELLVSLLDSHPAVMCDSEILSAKRVFPSRLIDSRSALAGLLGAEAYGFKLLRDHMWRQNLDPASYLERLHRRGFKVILLERRDLLQQAISFVRAVSTQYHYRRSDGIAFLAGRMDPVEILATMFVIEDAVMFWRSALNSIPHLSLVYEDDLVEPERQQEAVDRICGYVGVAPAPVTSELVKITPRSTGELIENFDELVAHLSTTRYARYLDAAATSPA